MAQEAQQPFTFIALLRLTRFWNLVIVAIAQYFAAICLIGQHTFTDVALFLLSSATVMVAAAGYIINDYYDIKIDLINKPERVVIGKTITRRYAILFHSVLSIAGVAIGFYLKWEVGLVNMVCVFLLWLYSNSLKRQPLIGNVTVALLTAASVYLINLLYYYTDLVTIYAVFAFAITLVREIIKDIEDLKGDDTFGCKTLPILWGVRKTKKFIYWILAFFVVTVALMNYYFSQLPQIYFLFFLLVPLVFFVVKLWRADTKNEFYQLSRWSKVLMILGTASMIFI